MCADLYRTRAGGFFDFCVTIVRVDANNDVFFSTVGVTNAVDVFLAFNHDVASCDKRDRDEDCDAGSFVTN